MDLNRPHTEIILGLSNEEYHSGSKYKDYISSTSLKNYRNGAQEYFYEKTKPRVDKAHFDLGSLIHDMLSAWHPEGLPFENLYHVWEDAPKNSKTGEYYGLTTQIFTEAYQKVKHETGKVPILIEQFNLAKQITSAPFDDNSKHPSAKIFRLLFSKGYPEVSYLSRDFLPSINIKTRHDHDGENFILDYKTIDGSITDFIRKITDYGYDISAGMYVENKKAGILFHSDGDLDALPDIKFYWVVFQVCPPYDWAIISAENYLESGIEKFYYLLNLHKKTLDQGYYGSIAELAPNKHGIFIPQPSLWQKKINSLI